MRIDRLISLNLVRPLRRAFDMDHASGTTTLPVLMYHSISDDSEPGSHPYYRVCTSPQRFRDQMQWLKNNDYRAVGLSAGLAWLNSPHGSNVTRHIAITFDDGFSDFYTHAFPILRQSGFSATMYLSTAFIGQSRRSFRPSTINPQLSTGRECLTWAEVRELHRTGIEFGSHTVHHPELVDLSWSDIQTEIQTSKAQIETEIGDLVRAFAYPYSFPQARPDFVGRFKDLLMAAGYETCVTTQIGRHRPDADLMQIKRLPVNSGDDVRLLQAKLEGGYDWLALPQLFSKSVRRHFSSSRHFFPKINGRDIEQIP
jgi:peptidoglycan/xylan/chitin deacetylase (PgdA/CDA1 family)